MAYSLSKRSRDNLRGVHPDLVRVVERAIQISTVDFGVSEGVRTIERQRQLYEQRRSQTMNSYHLTGDAVDLFAWVDGDVSFGWDYYEDIAKAMDAAAEEFGVEIVWGGTWKSLRDGPHFQRSRV